jgi:exopolysaccharide biosynthesis predicted pyruvyltransferase EpsI
MNFGKQTYAAIFSAYTGKTVGYFRSSGNWGDALIEKGALELFRDFGIKIVVINPDFFSIDLAALSSVTTVFLAGGGSLGTKYLKNHNARTELLKIFKGETIVLPQSMTDENDENLYTYTWLREVSSFQKKTGPKGICHDLAFYVNLDSYREQKAIYHVGVMLREDGESQKSIPLNLRDPLKLCHSLEEYIQLATRFETVITDRLHFAIIAAKLGRKVSLVAGNYYKIKAIYEFSMKFMQNVTFYETAKEAIAAELT